LSDTDAEPARLVTYVVARDYGFAPNPFHGFCTLATCKPEIRKSASVGDWVVGTGAVQYGLRDRLVFAMRVSETLDFQAYWDDPRFRRKRPNLSGSLKQLYGDNIYHRDPAGMWIQEDSHHSFEDGSPNPANVKRDLSVDRVLVSDHFAYWGSSAPSLPPEFRGSAGVCKVGRGHRRNFEPQVRRDFFTWLDRLMLRDSGCGGEPAEFRNHEETRQVLLFPSAP
jgi:hypothetical protein